jgi:hypothetical protein
MLSTKICFERDSGGILVLRRCNGQPIVAHSSEEALLHCIMINDWKVCISNKEYWVVSVEGGQVTLQGVKTNTMRKMFIKDLQISIILLGQ